MSIWGRIFAASYDRMMAKTEEAGLRAHRQSVVGTATGDVLEIGGGTGANLSLYGPEVRSLTVTEPEGPMAKRLEQHIAERRPGTTLVRAPAEDLPFEDASFDTVVSTLVLCTVDDQPRSLREIRRVLRPGGRLLFVEHVRSDDPKLARWQDRLLPFNRAVAHGCHCNRETLDAIRAEGFTVDRLERGQLAKAPPHVRPLIVGAAALSGTPASGSDRSTATPASA